MEEKGYSIVESTKDSDINIRVNHKRHESDEYIISEAKKIAREKYPKVNLSYLIIMKYDCEE